MKSRLMILALAVLLLLGGGFAFPFLRFRMVSSERNAGEGQVLIVGHRGAAGLAPENTLAAFKAGMISADMLELDVHLSGDGELIVAHDAKADRTTNGTGYWKDMTLAEIKTLDAGGWYDARFAGEKIPTLGEVLELVNGSHSVLIELKWPVEGVYDSMVQKVIRLIRERHAESWTIVQTFETRYLAELVSKAPDIVCYQLIYGSLNFPPVWLDRRFHFGTFQPSPGIDGVGCRYSFATSGWVKLLHARGLKTGAYTVNDPADMNRLMNLGVDMVITDTPSELRSQLAK